jgi:enoyl-CoA hydratase/carnithine racemase
MLVRLSRAPVMSMALIRGRATGVGSELALASDMRFASREKAILLQWEVGAGLVPGGGPMARLPRLIGRGRDLEVLFSADDFDGDLAELYGYVPKNLVLLGLIGLLDPPRKEAIEAVKECHGGGIRVTMITGDHKITAAAIAKMLDIGDGKTAISGAEIEALNEATLQEKVRNVDVFARASPEHKLRLVKAIQANKQIVAMTGDGVNDAPALKKADIGVSMGIKGTEVTKEAAGMILADDNFGRAHRLQQHREGHPLHATDQRRPGAVGDLPRLHDADHRTAGAVGQHGDVCCVGPGHLVRAARARCDEPAAARGGPADPHRLRHLARGLRGLGAACRHAVGVLLDEVPGRLGPARPDRRGQHDHHRRCSIC